MSTAAGPSGTAAGTAHLLPSGAVMVPHTCWLKFTRSPDVQAVTMPQLVPGTSPVVTVPPAGCCAHVVPAARTAAASAETKRDFMTAPLCPAAARPHAAI